MVNRSEEAYRRFRARNKKAKIARDMNVTRKTVTAWIEKEILKREKAYSQIKTLKNILGD